MLLEATPGKQFEKQDLQNLLFATNIFGHMEPGDYARWKSKGDTLENLMVELKMTHKGSDKSFARGFICLALGTLFGKLWDSYGYNRPNRLIEGHPTKKRGTDGQESPWFDLNIVRELTGFPCCVLDMPELNILTRTTIGKQMGSNTLIDTYGHYKGFDDINADIDPPHSKKLNIQFQLQHGATFSETAHAWGMSGGHILGECVIEGQRWRYAYKHETLGNNSFPFLSFCGFDGSKNTAVEEVPVTAVWNWVIENWGRVNQEAEKEGKSFFGLDEETLRKCWIDGMHLGHEILARSVGKIKHEALDIQMGDPKPVASAGGVHDGTHVAKKEKAPEVNTCEGQSEAKQDEPEKLEKGESIEKITRAGNKVGETNDEGLIFMPDLIMTVHNTEPLPGSGGGGNVYHLGRRPGLTSVVGTHPSLMIRALRGGRTTIKWRDCNGHCKTTDIYVE